MKFLNPFKSVIQTIFDIIKAHGGDLKVETREGEATTYIITLLSKHDETA